MSSSRSLNTKIIADIEQADSNNFTDVPVLKNHPNGFVLNRVMHRCDVETVVYMIEPWERFLLHALVILFLACLLHFSFGNSINWLSFFE